MFSVLIVEDEVLIRIGLKNMIKWNEIGMQVIAEAQNGMEALEIYNDKKPDLILTDIKMPVMDGLSLISEIRKSDKKTKIIILTCYKDFDLVHSALKLGVSDYVLKLKMSDQEITNIIEKIRDEMVLEQIDSIKNNETTPNSRRFADEIYKYLSNSDYTDLQIEEVFSEYSNIISNKKLVICLLHMENKIHLPNAVYNLLDEMLLNNERGISVREKDENYLLLLSFPDAADERHLQNLLIEFIEQIEAKIKVYFNLHMISGISTTGGRCNDLKRLYNEAKIALEYHYFNSDKNHNRYNIDRNNNNFIADIENFKSHIKMLEYEYPYFYNELSNEIDHLVKMFNRNKSEFQDVIIRLIYKFTTVNNWMLPDNINKLTSEFIHFVREASTSHEAIEEFKRFLDEALNYKMSQHMVSPETIEAIKYIKKNFTSKISLQNIADYVEMSMNYVSKLLKEELGVSFTTYINRLRVERAKHLLINTHMKSYEISYEIGFENESYFIRVFKNYTGQKPTEYRKIGLIDNESEDLK